MALARGGPRQLSRKHLAVSTIATPRLSIAPVNTRTASHSLRLNAVGIARRARCSADQLAVIRDRLKRIQPGIWPGGRR